MRLNILLGLLITGSIFSSCQKANMAEPNEEELITTMKLTFIPVGGGATLIFQFDDPDGPGGIAATTDEILLSPSTEYHVSLQLLNKTSNPVDDITAEVEGEAGAHRFYYEPSAGSNLVISGFDTDPGGLPLGINSIWTTGAQSTGNILITLRHYIGTPPDKAPGDPVNSAKSTTDIAVSYNTKIQ